MSGNEFQIDWRHDESRRWPVGRRRPNILSRYTAVRRESRRLPDHRRCSDATSETDRQCLHRPGIEALDHERSRTTFSLKEVLKVFSCMYIVLMCRRLTWTPFTSSVHRVGSQKARIL